MKKKKLTLTDIQVDSFVTSINSQHKETIQGANAMGGSWWVSDCLFTWLCPDKPAPIPSPDTIVPKPINSNPLNPACRQGHPSKIDPDACDILSVQWPPR